MKLSQIFIVVIVITLISCSGTVTTDNAQVDADIFPIAAKVNGTIARVLVADNQVVKAGDTLLVIDDNTYRLQMEQADIAVRLATQNINLSRNSSGAISAGVTSAKANLNAIEANIQSTTAAVGAAQVRYDLASKTFRRYQKLIEQNAVTQQQYDVVSADKDAALKQLELTQAQLNALKNERSAALAQVSASKSNADVSDDNVEISRIALKQAQANLELAKLQLSYCTIIAPAGGMVSKKSVQPGQVVAVGQPLLAITSHEKVWVVANLKETQMSDVQPGQDVEIYIDAYDDVTLRGRVQSIAQATGARFSLLPPDNATGNFVKVTQRIPVKIEVLENPDAKAVLRAGMSAYVKINTSR